MIVGYDPARIARLKHASQEAVGELARLGSADPAADAAVTAIARLRGVLEHELMTAVVDIERADPLVQSLARRGGPIGTDGSLGPGGGRVGRFEPTQWSHLDAIDLFVLLGIDFRTLAAEGLADFDDPFWTGAFPELVDEFEHRARVDPSFATLLVEEARTNPLIGHIVAAGDFDRAVVVGVLYSLVTADPLPIAQDTYRSEPILDLIEQIAARPEWALDLLTIDGAVEALYAWNLDPVNPVIIPAQLVGDLTSSALGVPFTNPSRLTDAYDVLGAVTALANARLFEDGFVPEVSLAITTSLVSYLPYFLPSFEFAGPFYLKGFDNRREFVLGTEEEVIDLFGALIRDADSKDVLLATIPLLALTSGSEFDLDDVENFTKTLVDASDGEINEEEIQAQRERDRWNLTIGIVTSLLDKGFDVGGTQFTTARRTLDWVSGGARWLVDLIDADGTGLGDVDRAAYMMLSLGLSAVFLRDPAAHRDRSDEDRAAGGEDAVDGVDGDPAILDEANQVLHEIGVASRDGKTLAEIEPLILDLRDLIEAAGGSDLLSHLDSVEPTTFDPASDTDLDE